MAMISKANQRNMHRKLYGGTGCLITIKLLKRGIDQQESTVTTYTLFQCRRGFQERTQEPLQDDMTARHTCRWMIPRKELDRLGLKDINVLDRIVENNTHPTRTYTWQPESDTNIDVKLFDDFVFCDCKRIDPPASIGQKA